MKPKCCSYDMNPKIRVGTYSDSAETDYRRTISANYRENPLSYKHKLSRYGFQEIEQRFCNYHKHPPLLMDGFDPDDLDRTFVDTLQWDAHEQCKLLFQCSMFASHAIKSI